MRRSGEALAVRVRNATSADIEFALAPEADADAAPFVIRWSRARHEQALRDPDQAHLVVTGPAGPRGFVPLARLTNEYRSIELRRIVNQGTRAWPSRIGARARPCFGRLAAHRVWLDVKVQNERARRAYAAVGFVEEGTLRDALLTNGVYESLVVMSILDREWPLETTRAGDCPGEAG
jgi:diamine N-acetyltransferase